MFGFPPPCCLRLTLLLSALRSRLHRRALRHVALAQHTPANISTPHLGTLRFSLIAFSCRATNKYLWFEDDANVNPPIRRPLSQGIGKLVIVIRSLFPFRLLFIVICSSFALQLFICSSIFVHASITFLTAFFFFD